MTRDDPAAFAPPPAFGPFRVLHQIGVGALGPVIRTYEPTRDRLVAVKVFRLDITPEQAQALADELSRAADAGLFHPSIVEPIAAGVEGTVAYRAEEYVAGESMDVAIRHYAPAPLDKVLPLLTQLAGAIDFARAAGVGHGALHLRDIFVTPDEARASGFGVVDALERVGLRAPVRRPYTAPERIAGEPWSTPADVFSLAAIGYELLTGRRPAGTGDQIGALTSDTAGDHAAAVRTVLARAMDDDPSRRYASALGFASALEAAARGGQVTDAVRDVSAISAIPLSPPAAPIASPMPLEPQEPPPLAPPIEQRPASAPIAHDIDVAPPADTELEVSGDEAFDELPGAAMSETPRFDRLDEEPEDELAEPRTLFDEDEPADVVMAARPPEVEPLAEEPLAEEPPADAFRAPRTEREPDLEPRRRARIDREAEPPPGLAALPPAGDRSRTAMLPVALGIIFSLLVGFAAGYAVRGRDVQSSAAAPDTQVAAPQGAAQGTTAPPAQAPAAGATGKEFSEQAVTPPPPQPASPAAANRPAPDVPGDEPPPARRETAAPARTSGTMIVRSTPSRAAVTINGRWRGRTPLTLNALKFGPYSIRVVQPGYSTGREEITLSEGQPTRTLSFRLQRERAATPARDRTAATPQVRPTSPERGATYSGVLYVDSLPRGATILVDGKKVGTTPARIPDTAIGSHVVRLELADHRAWSTSTRVAAGQETRVTGSLERIR